METNVCLTSTHIFMYTRELHYSRETELRTQIFQKITRTYKSPKL